MAPSDCRIAPDLPRAISIDHLSDPTARVLPEAEAAWRIDLRGASRSTSRVRAREKHGTRSSLGSGRRRLRVVEPLPQYSGYLGVELTQEVAVYVSRAENAARESSRLRRSH